MNQIARIGLDIAKRWFQIHAVDENGREVLNRKLPRDKVLGFLAALPACDVALEACSSSHHWGREIGRLGHRVRLISPNYVKPYLKRGKSDAHDARAICEAASRPDMRFVGVKSEEQQAALMQHTSRQLLIDQRTAVANSLRGQLAEFGVIERKGIENVGELVRMLDEDAEALAQVPVGALTVMKILADQLRAVDAHLSAIDEEIEAWRRENAAAQALKTIPGVGALISAALLAHVPDPSMFRSGRDFAAWLGLVPRQNSSGGKERLGRITAGQPVFEAAPRPGSDGELALAPQAVGSIGGLDQAAPPPSPGAARHRGACQQAGAHRLGDNDDGRIFPLGNSDGVRIEEAVERTRRRRREHWPVRSEVMNSRRTADQDIPNPDRRPERAELMTNLVRG